MTPVRRLKELVDPHRSITYGIVQAGDHVPDGVPYIRPVDMSGNDGVLDPSSLLRTSHEIGTAYGRSELRAGDLVVSIGPSFGKIMVVPDELSGANLTQGTARVAPGREVDRRYLYWALQSSGVTAHWERSVSGATFRALNLGPLADTPIPLPIPRSQHAIADYLDAEVERVDQMVDALTAANHLVDEWLRAMVTEVVWGKSPETAPLMRLAQDYRQIQILL